MTSTSTQTEPDGVSVSDVRTLRHGFSRWGASALSFAAMRPLVGIVVGGYVIGWAGLAGWMSAVVVLALILVVALVFGALAGRWPLEGSVAAWTRQLLGARTGLMAGWLYLCSYVRFMGALAFYDAQRFVYLADLKVPSPLQSAVLSAVVLLVATVLNSMSRRLLVWIMYLGVVTSVVGSLVFATMLIAHAKRGFFDLFHSVGGGPLDWAWWTGPFVVAVAWTMMFCLRGFELPTDVAEEVREPRVNVKRAMVWPLLVGGAITIYTMIAVALAIPAASNVTGEVSQNPYAASVGTVMESVLGVSAARAFAVLMIIVTFTALAVWQVAASRTLWTMARVREVPLHGRLVQLSSGPRMPVTALIVVGLGAATLAFVLPERTAYVLGGASAVPLLLALLLPVIGLWRARRRGEWNVGTSAESRWLGPASRLVGNDACGPDAPNEAATHFAGGTHST